MNLDPLTGVDSIGREEAKSLLQMAIQINMYQTCPGNVNFNAGTYALEAVVPNELTQSRYTRGSIDLCFAALAVTPCNLEPDSNATILGNLYRSVLRSCGLEPSEL